MGTLTSATRLTLALFGVGAALFFGGAQAQMCKWVDEDGTVHYAQECPEGVESKDVDVSDAIKGTNFDDPYANSGSKSASGSKKQSSGKQKSGGSSSRNYTKVDCERAREARLKPERENLVKSCQAGGKDAAYCTRYYANHGDGGRQGGRTVPRKYDNLPECVGAR